MSIDARAHADELRAAGSPFVLATVVRAQRPTSAKPGAHAVIRADGTIVGFVGGECAQASVRAQALAALESGEPTLLRIVPDALDAESSSQEQPGVVTVHNPCLSGGTLEVFLEPTLPVRRFIVHGHSPIAVALAELAGFLGYSVENVTHDGGAITGLRPEAVVVASHGEAEAEPLVAAVRAGVPYVALVASRRRGPEVLAALDLSAEEKARIRSPAGIDIKARTPEEVAVSIVAEIIAARGAEATSAPIPRPAPATAIDPVCGMTVAAVDATLHTDDESGLRYWFCGAGCRDAFVANPTAFARR